MLSNIKLEFYIKEEFYIHKDFHTLELLVDFIELLVDLSRLRSERVPWMRGV